MGGGDGWGDLSIFHSLLIDLFLFVYIYYVLKILGPLFIHDTKLELVITWTLSHIGITVLLDFIIMYCLVMSIIHTYIQYEK